MVSRREFIGTTAGAVGFAAMSAKSYGQIAGANERVNFAIIGLNGRGYAHLNGLKNNAKTSHVAYVCDVDSKILDKFCGAATKDLGYTPESTGDFRKILAMKNIDAITIATPDHWHAPMAIRGLQAGKHVYVEKPSSHNPREGELLIEAQKKYGKMVQVGDQQRSSPHTIEMIEKIHSGSLIGRAYYGKAWYAQARKSMGIGKQAPVPAALDWELWQGPAVRDAYYDNRVPYNWHWIRNYGTGEALNNGTHEVDIARWALDVDYPQRVTASGGRYAFADDWQFPDTMVTNFEYDGPGGNTVAGNAKGKMISWEGFSASGKEYYKRGRGVTIHGETGTVLIDREGYEVYDQKDKMVDSFVVPGHKGSTADLLSRDSMTDAHFGNFIAAIQTGEKLHSPIPIANVSVTILQLSNIAWEVGRELKLDTTTGHILGDADAMKKWGRAYAKGWEVVV